MHDQPTKPMIAENVDDFDVWILNSSDLVISILPIHAPRTATAENYQIDEPIEY